MYLEEEISNLDLDLEEKERILQREPPKVSVGRFDYTGSLEEEKKIKNNRKMNYEEAKKLLSESGKSGKILRKDDDSWDVEFNNIENLNNVLIDLSKDIWLYVSKDYLKQKISLSEVGSSTMPHKVNPIDFENAEGNLTLSNSLIPALKNLSLIHI